MSARAALIADLRLDPRKLRQSRNAVGKAPTIAVAAVWQSRMYHRALRVLGISDRVGRAPETPRNVAAGVLLGEALERTHQIATGTGHNHPEILAAARRVLGPMIVFRPRRSEAVPAFAALGALLPTADAD